MRSAHEARIHELNTCLRLLNAARRGVDAPLAAGLNKAIHLIADRKRLVKAFHAQMKEQSKREELPIHSHNQSEKAE